MGQFGGYLATKYHFGAGFTYFFYNFEKLEFSEKNIILTRHVEYSFSQKYLFCLLLVTTYTARESREK